MSIRSAPARALRRRQLDRHFAPLPGLRSLPIPKRGWIAEVRDALGMTTRQLAHRLGTAQQSVIDLQRSEVRGTISLNSLGKAADALDCELVYALVPRESFERIVRDRARAVAIRIVGRVEHSMTLEDQAAGAAEREEAIAELTDELIRTASREVWDPWD